MHEIEFSQKFRKKEVTIRRMSIAIPVINLLGVGRFVVSESAIETKAQYPTADNDESDL